MTTPTFIPPVSPSSLQDKPEIRISTTEFGDGYTQETRRGLNHVRRVLQLRWEVLTQAQARTILSFLEERGGDRTFAYRVPGEEQPIKVTCREWIETRLPAGLVSIEATFRQSFALA